MKLGTVLSMILGLAATPAEAAEPVLFGATRSDGAHADLVSIDLGTGKATKVLEFPVPAGFVNGTMAWHAPSGRFVFLCSPVSGGAASRLLALDPVTGATTESVVTGLPAGHEKTSGLEYDAVQSQLLLTFGPTGTFSEDRVAAIELDGTVTQTTPPLGVGDRDVIGFDASAGELHLCDFNAPNAPSVVRVDNLFASPTFTVVADPPDNGDRGDVAFDPATGALYVVGFTPGGGELVRVVGSAWQVLGPFLASDQITGFAFAWCQDDLGYGNGASALTVCGGDLSSGAPAVMSLVHAPASRPAFLFVGASASPTPVFELGGTLVPVPILLFLPLATDGAGELHLPVPGGLGPFTVFVQYAIETAPSLYEMSNSVRIDLLP